MKHPLTKILIGNRPTFIGALVAFGFAFTEPVSAETYYANGQRSQWLGIVNPQASEFTRRHPLRGEFGVFALQPVTGRLFALGRTEPFGRSMHVIDPATGNGSELFDRLLYQGNSTRILVSMTFAGKDKLYAVTGSGNPEFDNQSGVVVEVDLTNGTLTRTGWATTTNSHKHLLNYCPDDGCLYHFTHHNATGETKWERIDPRTGVVTPIPLSGADPGSLRHMAYAGSNRFFGMEFTGKAFYLTTDGSCSYWERITSGVGLGGIACTRILCDGPLIRPDLKARSIGDDRYNRSGSRQKKTRTVARAATHRIQIENDGGLYDGFTLNGRKRYPNARMKYLLGGRNVTAAMHRGTQIANLFSREKVNLIVKVRKSGSRPGSRVTRVRATSQSDPAQSDTFKTHTIFR